MSENQNSNSIYNVPGHTQAEDTLLSYPPAIQAAQKELLTLFNNYENQNIVVKEAIAGFNAKVSNNPALKNVDQKATELKALIAASGEYKDDLEALNSLRLDCDLKRIDLEYLQNMFKAHLAIVGGHR